MSEYPKRVTVREINLNTSGEYEYPSITLGGKDLEQAGFEIGDAVKVIVESGVVKIQGVDND